MDEQFNPRQFYQVGYDWSLDEFPVIPPPVSWDIKKSHRYIGRKQYKCASGGEMVKMRKYYKPRVKRHQRRRIKEMLTTGIEPRNINRCFSWWDII